MSGENTVDMGGLAEAFGADEKDVEKNKAEMEKQINGGKKVSRKSGRNKKSVAIFVIGMLALAAGLAFLIFKLVSGPSKADAEFMVSAGDWVREDAPSVIWDFTEIGKGKLTTDNHANDYDFIWALDGNKLKIETDWLYNLSDEFEYSLDQGGKVLTIKNADKNIEIKFKAKK